MVGMELDSKLVLDDKGDAIRRPQISVEAAGLAARHENFKESSELVFGKTGGSERGCTSKTFDSCLTNSRSPTTYRGFTDTVLASDLALLNAVGQFPGGGQPSAFHLFARQARFVSNGASHHIMGGDS